MSHASRHKPTVVVLGAGAWGTVLALLAHQAGGQVRLWARRADHAESMRRDRRNADRLAGVPLPADLHIDHDLEAVLEGADLTLVAVPSLTVRPLLRALPAATPATGALVLCSKGIEPEGFRRLSQVVAEERPEARVAVLSGPNLASEIAVGKPTAATVASADAALAQAVQGALAQSTFRVYTSTDVVGVEVGAALKNVIALAAGMSDGLQLGENAKATIITRGLAEVARLGTFLGGEPRTFYGLTGLGDMIATCSSRASRNHQAGVRIAEGASLQQLEDSGATTEGIPTVLAVHGMLERAGLVLPIAHEVYQVVYRGKSPGAAIRALMEREPRAE